MTDERPDGVLSPTDLEPNDEHLRRLGDGRHVVTTDGGGSEPQQVPNDSGHGTQPAAELAELEGEHALVAGARAEGEEDAVVADTDDVSEAFETLLRWYTDVVAEEHSPEEALAVLLANTDLDVDASVC
jgi:hypothetical protein